MLGDPPVERTVQRILQLISEAETQPAGGFRAVLARRSWSRLARAHQSSMMDRNRAYRAVLDDWAAAGAPDDPRPELLARWVGGRRRFAVHLKMLAQPPDHPRGPPSRRTASGTTSCRRSRPTGYGSSSHRADRTAASA